jgi:hypothetical protein
MIITFISYECNVDFEEDEMCDEILGFQIEKCLRDYFTQNYCSQNLMNDCSWNMELKVLTMMKTMIIPVDRLNTMMSIAYFGTKARKQRMNASANFRQASCRKRETS